MIRFTIKPLTARTSSRRLGFIWIQFRYYYFASYQMHCFPVFQLQWALKLHHVSYFCNALSVAIYKASSHLYFQSIPHCAALCFHCDSHHCLLCLLCFHILATAGHNPLNGGAAGSNGSKQLWHNFFCISDKKSSFLLTQNSTFLTNQTYFVS